LARGRDVRRHSEGRAGDRDGSDLDTTNDDHAGVRRWLRVRRFRLRWLRIHDTGIEPERTDAKSLGFVLERLVDRQRHPRQRSRAHLDGFLIDLMARGRNVAIEIDRIACDGRGMCAELLPELVQIDDWGYPIVKPNPVPPELLPLAKDAVMYCPALAFRLRPTSNAEVPARA
jgi:ferredoxin